VALTRGGCGDKGANAATAQTLQLKNKDGAEKPRSEVPSTAHSLLAMTQLPRMAVRNIAIIFTPKTSN